MTDRGHAILLTILLAVSFLFGAVRFISPLGIGFADWPEDPAQAAFARTIYFTSHALGLPLLALGQLWGLLEWKRGRLRQGLLVSAVTFGLSFVAAL